MSTRSTIYMDDLNHLFDEGVPDFDAARVQMEIPREFLIDKWEFSPETGHAVIVAIPVEILRAIQNCERKF